MMGVVQCLQQTQDNLEKFDSFIDRSFLAEQKCLESESCHTFTATLSKRTCKQTKCTSDGQTDKSIIFLRRW